MKRIFLKNGTEVHVGDVISKTKTVNHPIFGKITVMKTITVSESNIPELISKKILYYSNSKTFSSNVPTDINYYIGLIAKRLEWKEAKTINYINNISRIYPAAAYSIILREVAKEIDKGYKDHISTRPSIYIISIMDGEIKKVNKENIKTYKTFSAFRTLEDAKLAKEITSNLLNKLF